MTDHDELRKLYADYKLRDHGWISAETKLIESVPSLLDELDRTQDLLRLGDRLANALERKQRELEELRSAARELLDARHARHVATTVGPPAGIYDPADSREAGAAIRLRALVALSVPETEETTDA